MDRWKKILLGTGIGAGVIGLATYFTRLKRASVELEAVTKTTLHSLKQDGLTIRTDLNLKNPTGASFSIKYPFVRIIYREKIKKDGEEKNKDTVIGASHLIDKDIKIPANGEARIDGVMIKIPLASFLTLGGGLLKTLQTEKPIKVIVRTVSTIDLGWAKVPYEREDEHELKLPKS